MAKLGTLVLSLPIPAPVRARAEALFDCVEPQKHIGTERLLEAANANNADAVLISLGIPMKADAIARLPTSVKIIASTSVGFDHIDVAAANARGIVVGITPDAVTDATADVTMLLMLGACRRAKEHVRSMDQAWSVRNGFFDGLGLDLTGKTLGIVGMGRIGRAVAERCRGFRMPVLYHNRSRLSPDLEGDARYFASLDEMLPHCQVLSLNLPGGQGVIMTAEKFALLPKGALFVNSARGNLVDEDAMIDALKSGQLFAAGLDVFKNEPNYDTRINELPNTFLLPHIGTATIESRTDMSNVALDNIEAVLSGRPAPFPVKL
ncbi:MAG TPA: D-glycerate dehydrogenase [Hyphomonadaceae bacterium]|nr:D-glycerate dehydrogenase [Hyphomonadaceae bacterium]HPI47177.1 D-glycerate dehydrogenase [Hyphomonadaceae bacterium]